MMTRNCLEIKLSEKGFKDFKRPLTLATFIKTFSGDIKTFRLLLNTLTSFLPGRHTFELDRVPSKYIALCMRVI